MEKILSPDERIKRAEEIYYRRKIQAMNKKSARVNVTEKKDIHLFKKMFLQIIICVLIYTIFYMIKTTNYIFSENVIRKTNEILKYDINIEKLYEQAKDYINLLIRSVNKESDKTTIQQETQNDNKVASDVTEMEQEENQDNKLTNLQDENVIKLNQDNQNNIGGENVKISEQKISNLTQMEQDAKDILSTKSFILPLKGTITSRYGPRNPTTAGVPKFHTGIDIAVNEGTVFIASMEGLVKSVSTKGDYGNHIKIVNDDVMTIYAHCRTIYVKEGDKIIQGQNLGEVGSTGNVTGPHLHFEIRKENRYVNPELILKFD